MMIEEALTTELLSKAIGIKPESIRVHLCKRGSYFGIRPIKMANRRLIWPSDSVEQLKAILAGKPELKAG